MSILLTFFQARSKAAKLDISSYSSSHQSKTCPSLSQTRILADPCSSKSVFRKPKLVAVKSICNWSLKPRQSEQNTTEDDSWNQKFISSKQKELKVLSQFSGSETKIQRFQILNDNLRRKKTGRLRIWLKLNSEKTLPARRTRITRCPGKQVGGNLI